APSSGSSGSSVSPCSSSAAKRSAAQSSCVSSSPSRRASRSYGIARVLRLRKKTPSSKTSEEGMQSLLRGGLSAVVTVVMWVRQHIAGALRQPLLAPFAETVIRAQLLVFRRARQILDAVNVELRRETDRRARPYVRDAHQ